MYPLFVVERRFRLNVLLEYAKNVRSVIKVCVTIKCFCFSLFFFSFFAIKERRREKRFFNKFHIHVRIQNIDRYLGTFQIQYRIEKKNVLKQ